MRRQFTFYQKFLVWPWSHPVVLNLGINPVITKYKLKSQFKLIQLWPLTVNCFKVISQSYLAGFSKICFLCTYVDQMTIQQRFSCFKFRFTVFLLMFFPIFSKLFANISKIYELLKACVRCFLSNFYFFSPNGSPLKTMKNVFYFV